jgi:hypothetical protein
VTMTVPSTTEIEMGFASRRRDRCNSFCRAAKGVAFSAAGSSSLATSWNASSQSLRTQTAPSPHGLVNQELAQRLQIVCLGIYGVDQRSKLCVASVKPSSGKPLLFNAESGRAPRSTMGEGRTRELFF